MDLWRGMDDTGQPHTGLIGPGDLYILFGSFSDREDEDEGSVADFSFKEMLPCICEEQEEGGQSLGECVEWVVQFVIDFGNLDLHPSVKFVHWKSKHLVFFGPLINDEGLAQAHRTIQALGIENHSRILTMPRDDEHSTDSFSVCSNDSSTEVTP
jgi:hypothetical protein